MITDYLQVQVANDFFGLRRRGPDCPAKTANYNIHFTTTSCLTIHAWIYEDIRAVLAPMTIRTRPSMVKAGDFRSQPRR